MDLKFELYDPKVLKALPKVTSPRLTTNQKFDPEGLFSEQIFGPVKDYKCQCERVTAPRGQRCSKCGVLVASSNLRKKIFAAIELPESVISPQAYNLIKSVQSLRTFYQQLLSGRYGIAFDDQGKAKLVEINIHDFSGTVLDLEQKYDVHIGQRAMEQLIINAVKNGNQSKIFNILYSLIKEGSFFTDYVLVIPPYYRPYKDKHIAEINQHYLTILTMIKNTPQRMTISNYLFQLELQKVCDGLVDDTMRKFGSKTGILRQKLAGKRLDLSGRAVIVPADIPETHAEIPYLILLQLYKLEITAEIVKNSNRTYREVFEMLDEQYDSKVISEEVKSVIDKVCTNQYVLLNRQPTLHRGSILAFKIKPVDGYTIGLNHLVVEPFNADYDGDTLYGRINITIGQNKYDISCHISDLESMKVKLDDEGNVIKTL